MRVLVMCFHSSKQSVVIGVLLCKSHLRRISTRKFSHFNMFNIYNIYMPSCPSVCVNVKVFAAIYIYMCLCDCACVRTCMRACIKRQCHTTGSSIDVLGIENDEIMQYVGGAFVEYIDHAGYGRTLKVKQGRWRRRERGRERGR